MPDREEGRSPRATAAQIAALVPEGETLYLCDLKDEGILFYYGRPARRVDHLRDLTGMGRPVYCVLTEAEWKARSGAALLWLRDEQARPMVLARMRAESIRKRTPGVKSYSTSAMMWSGLRG